MRKLTLVGVTYNIECIDGLTFLIPSRLRSWERRIRTNLRKIIRKLKTARYYDYVLSADMVTVILPSDINDQFTIVFNSQFSIQHPVFFIDSGGLVKRGITWNASVFVHEATHVFQNYCFSKMEQRHRDSMEENANKTQAIFLARSGHAQLAKYILNLLKKPRRYWEWMNGAPENEEELLDEERYKYSLDALTELTRHILI